MFTKKQLMINFILGILILNILICSYVILTKNLQMKQLKEIHIKQLQRMENRVQHFEFVNNNYINSIKDAVMISWICSKSKYISINQAKDLIKNIQYILDNKPEGNRLSYLYDNRYKYNLQAFFIAIMKTESSFHRLAKSKTGAVGLMQINPNNLDYINICKPKNLSYYNKKNLFEIRHNLCAGLIMIDNYLQVLNNRYRKFNTFTEKKQIFLILKLYLGKSNFKYQNTIYKDYIKLKQLLDIKNIIN